ncbi:glycosyltransferase [Adhaeribacter radiodurans]|uniref:Glycosyltransferase n=1 Tax=Adhaeribacter radiodurans TaxID=2745197 RepID=A0A7L7L984_9BACT|nr:glycosyltransferase [Adhaeribacter radiodurans]QMU29381.1 glycosyltransferase [Adhaeribacter radiodurans]
MKILILLSRVPYLLDKGDKLRAFYQLQKLSEKHEIILFALADKTDPLAEATQELLNYCRYVHLFPLPKASIMRNVASAFWNKKPIQVNYFYDVKAQAQIDELIAQHQPDHIYCQLIRMAEYVRHVKQIPKTLDYMDAFSKGMLRRAEIAPFHLKPIFRLEAARLKKYEAAVFADFRYKTIISRQDRDFIAHPRHKDIAIVPNGIQTSYFHPLDVPKQYDLVFTGNMNYAPNIEAAIFLVKKVLPLIKKQFPEIRILLAGANPSYQVLSLESPNVTVSGWLPDIREAYASARVFVAPLFIGTGVQNKVLEAMAMKVPCVTTQLVNNGVGAANNCHLLVANTPGEFAQHIYTLLTNRDLNEKLTQRALDFVHENYSWSKAVGQLEQVFDPEYENVEHS